MPRTPTGFDRINGEFVGSQVWQDDLNADVKIIASRHDIHDEDLAQEIFMSLPRDGSQPMLGDLDMNNNEILNWSQDAMNPESPARLGDVVNGASWNPTTDVLTLQKELGDDITVLIPLPDGAGAAGTVTSITPGAGLQSINVEGGINGDPITKSGTLRLDIQNGITPGTYNWANVTVNSQGIVTGISSNPAPGGGGGTTANLNVVQDSSKVLIQDTAGGSSDNILAVSATRWGVVTPAQKAAWDQAVTDVGDIAVNWISQGYNPVVQVQGKPETASIVNVWSDEDPGNGQTFGGVFIGDITTAAPADGAATSRPRGFVWFEI